MVPKSPIWSKIRHIWKPYFWQPAKTLTRNLGNLDEVLDSHGEPNGPQNRIPGISRVPRMYLDFRSSSNPIGAKLLECERGRRVNLRDLKNLPLYLKKLGYKLSILVILGLFFCALPTTPCTPKGVAGSKFLTVWSEFWENSNWF